MIEAFKKFNSMLEVSSIAYRYKDRDTVRIEAYLRGIGKSLFLKVGILYLKVSLNCISVLSLLLIKVVGLLR